MKHGERLVDQSINLDPLAQRRLPVTERPLPRDMNLTHLRSARGGLDPLDKLAKLLLEVVEVSEQIGFEHHEQIPVVLIRVEHRAGEQPECLHDKGQPKALIAAER